MAPRRCQRWRRRCASPRRLGRQQRVAPFVLRGSSLPSRSQPPRAAQMMRQVPPARAAPPPRRAKRKAAAGSESLRARDMSRRKRRSSRAWTPVELREVASLRHACRHQTRPRRQRLQPLNRPQLRQRPSRARAQVREMHRRRIPTVSLTDTAPHLQRSTLAVLARPRGHATVHERSSTRVGC